MQIIHVMVMVLMIFVQKDMKITGIQSALHDPGDMDLESVYRKACEGSFKCLSIRTQIQEGSHHHIPADPGCTF